MGTTSNLIQGPAHLYVGAFGITEPTDASVNVAPYTSAGWTDLGFTSDGVTMTIAQEYSELEVDQLIDIPARRLVKREVTVATNLAEATLEAMKYSLNAGTAASGTGYKSLTPDFAETTQTLPTYVCMLMDGIAPGGFIRRFILRKSLQVNDVEFAYAKDEQTVFSVEFAGHYVTTAIAPFKIIDGV